MERFCHSIEDKEISEALSRNIEDDGDYYRFKNAANKLGVAQCWRKYKTEQLTRIARQWCEDHGIKYVDGATG